MIGYGCGTLLVLLFAFSLGGSLLGEFREYARHRENVKRAGEFYAEALQQAKEGSESRARQAFTRAVDGEPDNPQRQAVESAILARRVSDLTKRAENAEWARNRQEAYKELARIDSERRERWTSLAAQLDGAVRKEQKEFLELRAERLEDNSLTRLLRKQRDPDQLARSRASENAWRVTCYKDGAVVFSDVAWEEVKVRLTKTVFQDIAGNENSFPGRDCSKTALSFQEKLAIASQHYRRF